MKRRTGLLVAAMCPWLLCGVPLAIASGPGTTSLNFLKLGVGARQLGMGSAGVALADDVNGVWWNPAAYGSLQRQELSFLYAKWVEGVAYQHMGYAYPHHQWGTFGVDLTALQVTDVKGFDQRDNPTGDITVQDWSLGVGWGRSLGDRWRVGGVLKGLREQLATVKATGVAADIGVTVQPWLSGWAEGLNVGGALRNVGPNVKFDQVTSGLPLSTDAGVAYTTGYDALRVAVDWQRPQAGRSFLKTGFEYWVGEHLALRGGYRSQADVGNGLSLGIGFKAWDLQLDYAFLDQGPFGMAHRVSLLMRFGGIAEQMYQRGLDHMREGQYAQAILAFNQVLSREPRHRRALRRMQQCAAKLQARDKESP